MKKQKTGPQTDVDGTYTPSGFSTIPNEIEAPEFIDIRKETKKFYII